MDDFIVDRDTGIMLIRHTAKARLVSQQSRFRAALLQDFRRHFVQVLRRRHARDDGVAHGGQCFRDDAAGTAHHLDLFRGLEPNHPRSIPSKTRICKCQVHQRFLDTFGHFDGRSESIYAPEQAASFVVGLQRLRQFMVNLQADA